MGCTASKQGLLGNKSRENYVASWYNPLPRSISARPYLHTSPCEPPSYPSIHSSDEDPTVAGSFIRLLHKKKSMSPSSGHQQKYGDQCHAHSHTCAHHHPGSECMEMHNLFTKKHAHARTCHHEICTSKGFPQAADEYLGATLQLQQLQLVNLSSTHKHNFSSRENNLAMENQAPHLFESMEDNAPSFRCYREPLPPAPKGLRSKTVHAGDNNGVDGEDEHMHVEFHDITESGGLRQQRKSRFAPKPTKNIAHHVQTKSTEKSLSFNVGLDDGFTEMGSPALPKLNMLEEQSILSKKRKNSSDFSVSSINLDGLEDKLYERPGSTSKHHQVNGFAEAESLNVVESIDDPKLATESSAFNADIAGGSQLNSPFRSPARSPTLSSLKSSSSPLFDPSILAAFEEAIESVCYSAPDDGWMLVDDASNEPSSLSSSDKFTWVSSEPSSDEESARHSDEIFMSNLHQVSAYPDFPQGDNDVKRQKVDGIFSGLDRFELRCPPKGEDKIVLYFTSLRGVRKTYQDCCDLRLILQGLGVDVDERDVWMHLKFREELADLVGERGLPIPRVFIKGRYIGGVEEVKQLHEDGLLVRLIEDLPTFGKFRKSCDGCADVRFIPCLTCCGSCKLLDDELDEMVKCFECNENGLIMCPICTTSR